MLDMKEKTPACEAGATKSWEADSLDSSIQNLTLAQVAIDLLTRNQPQLSQKAGSFLGQLAVSKKSGADLSAKQLQWLEKLIGADQRGETDHG